MLLQILLQSVRYLLDILPSLSPPLCSLRLCGSFPSEIPTTGAALKAVEDKLDSLICAYVAAYWWYWGEQRNLVLGDVYDGRSCGTTGYIVIPQRILA